MRTELQLLANCAKAKGNGEPKTVGEKRDRGGRSFEKTNEAASRDEKNGQTNPTRPRPGDGPAAVHRWCFCLNMPSIRAW